MLPTARSLERTTVCGHILSVRMLAFLGSQRRCLYRARMRLRMQFMWSMDRKHCCFYLVDSHSKTFSDHPLLYKSAIVAQDWQWIWANAPPANLVHPDGLKARVQFRHRMSDVGCIVRRYCGTIPVFLRLILTFVVAGI